MVRRSPHHNSNHGVGHIMKNPTKMPRIQLSITEIGNAFRHSFEVASFAKLAKLRSRVIVKSGLCLSF